VTPKQGWPQASHQHAHTHTHTAVSAVPYMLQYTWQPHRSSRPAMSTWRSTDFGQVYYAPAPRVGGIKRWCALTSVYLSVAYIGPKSRTERPRKTEIGIEVGHVTRYSDTTLLSRSKGQRPTCRWRGHIVAASRTAC